LDIKTREVLYNPKYDDMYAPVFGPTNPNLTQQQRSHKNLLNAHVESTNLSDFQFENQRRTFDSFGYAADPSVGEHATTQIIGDQVSAEMNEGKSIFETKRKSQSEKRKKEKKIMIQVMLKAFKDLGLHLLMKLPYLVHLRKIKKRSMNI